MQTRFLLGPAGSGKTFRCLAEVRAALADEPDGAIATPKRGEGGPLIFLAPKQATFQTERQLLDSERWSERPREPLATTAPGLPEVLPSRISGFSRLHILSFDRLAQFIFDQLHIAPPKLLSGEGRLMVLRALLLRHGDELKLFKSSAKRSGFVPELGALLAELQEHQFGPAKLQALAASKKLPAELRSKLHDLALLSQSYANWLKQHGLQDANCLLDMATEALRHPSINHQSSSIHFAGLWLDGFAEMTPQELALLAAVIPFCQSATLAFCLETEPSPTESWLSIWSSIGKTFQRCRDQINSLPGCEIKVETLPRQPSESRFVPDSELATLEENWTLANLQPAACRPPPATVRVVACEHPDAEAAFAAREILKFVRAGNRFRDCAVLVRQLDTHHQALTRMFRRYDIPFFLDRRESVAHHPLAELTRNALRLAAFDWRPEDLFAALKCGFTAAAESAIDDLENRALEFGWRGQAWAGPLPDEASERIRQQVLPPFAAFFHELQRWQFKPNGVQLAEAVRALWSRLNIEETLAAWVRDASHPASPHQTVWEQMDAWLDNVRLAFPDEALPLADWLPILEAGLGSLTVGVIPPALDEVLVGAIDRARNPDLKFVLVLGVNESLFPAAPRTPVILTASDREALEAQAVTLGGSSLDQISRERYLGYIACTRASEKLALTFARQGTDGRKLNPSPLIAHLQRMFPGLAIEEFSPANNPLTAEHPMELVPLLMTAETGAPALLKIPALKLLAEKLAALHEPLETETLSPGLAAKIYGPKLRTSISRLEEFASCPFRFFMRVGLRAGERKLFELDARERGNFQHDVLKTFHEQLTAEGKRWRDLTISEARERIKTIASSQMESHRDGLFRATAESAFAAQVMTAALQDFVGVIVGWMHSQYDFDPALAEFGFGGKDDPLPPWELDLGGGRKLALQGRIDRVDIWRDPASDTLLAVVIDYKSGGKKLEPLLVENGIQLQLLAYLGALKSFSRNAPSGSLSLVGRGEETNRVSAEKLFPAGAFYVSLRGKFESGKSRGEVLDDPEAGRKAYQHSGRFDAGWLRKFDRRAVDEGDQFKFKLNKKDGLPSKNSEARPTGEFQVLLKQVEDTLKQLGESIFSGHTAVAPYRKGHDTPCDLCDYRAACRLDEWTHEFRELRPETKTGETTE